MEIYVVDNGSTDGSLSPIESNCPSIRLIRFDKNFLGFAEAYSRAITGIEAKYVVLLNNDAGIGR
jgi:GT2 family glycosyltransferase